MRVSMDSSIISDPKFKVAAKILGIPFEHLVGCCFQVWLAAYDRRSERFSKLEADVAANFDGFSDAFVSVGLATEHDDESVSFHGVKKRIEFLKGQAERGSKGGKSSAKSKAKANAKRTLKRGSKRTLSNGLDVAQPYTITTAPDPSSDDPPDLDSARSARTRVATPVPDLDQGSDLVAVAGRLWATQEALRAELGLPPVPMFGREPLVIAAVEAYGETALDHALRVCARVAREKPGERDWFNGKSNWHPTIIDQRLGQAVEPAAKAAPGTGQVAAMLARARELEEQGL